MSAPLGVALDAVLETFGQPVALRLVGVLPAELVSAVGVFDAPHRAVDLDTLQASVVGPSVLVRLSDLPRTPERGDEVTVGETLYRVRDVQPDGQGGALLILQR